MKKLLLAFSMVMFCFVAAQAQQTRPKIKQFQLAPGERYMILTDGSGTQYYTPFDDAVDTINSDTRLNDPRISGDTLYFTVIDKDGNPIDTQFVNLDIFIEVERNTGAPGSTPTGNDPIIYVNESNGDFYTWDGSQWIQIGGGDHDWYVEGTSTPSDNNTKDIYTQGNVGINYNYASGSVIYPLEVFGDRTKLWTTGTNTTIEMSVTGNNFLYQRFIEGAGDIGILKWYYPAQTTNNLFQFRSNNDDDNLLEMATGATGGTGKYIEFFDEYKFPLADGTADYVMATDGAGQLYWKEDATGGGGGGGTWVEEIFDTQSGTTVNVAGNLPSDAANIVVFVNGIQQANGATRDWTHSANTITFEWTLASDRVVARYIPD